MFTPVSIAVFILTLVGAETTLLLEFADGELGIIKFTGIVVLKMISLATVQAIAWLTLSPKEKPIGSTPISTKTFPVVFLALALLSYGCAPKAPLSEGAIYNQLKSVSAGYEFAHEAIKKFSDIVQAQRAAACPSDPGGFICKTANGYVAFYTEKLYPTSVQATEIWEAMLAAFDTYRQIESPTQGDLETVLNAIKALEEIIIKLKGLFSSVPVAMANTNEIIQHLDAALMRADEMRLAACAHYRDHDTTYTVDAGATK